MGNLFFGNHTANTVRGGRIAYIDDTADAGGFVHNLYIDTVVEDNTDGIVFRVGNDTTVSERLKIRADGAIVSQGNIFAQNGSGIYTQSAVVGAGNGNVCFSTAGPNHHLHRCVASSARYKNTINSLSKQSNLDKVRLLNPVSYYYNADYTTTDTGLQQGFIAEEVAAIDPAYINYDEFGRVENVQYNKITVLLTGAIQQLDLQVQNLESRLTQAEATLAVLNSTTTNLTKANLTVTNTTSTLNLTVTGTATIANLKVTGLTELADLKVDRIISKGNVPVAIELAGAGVNGVLPVDPQVLAVVTGNDTAGVASINTGVGATAGDLIEVTFDKPYSQAPIVTLTPLGQEAATVRYYIKSVTTTGFIISVLDAPTDNTEYKYQYQIIQ
jgi:hypothetical protein